MIDLVKVGAILTLIGFFAVGSVDVVLGLASLPKTPDQIGASATSAKNALVVQGLGWILAGVGLSMALFGSAKNDTAVDMKLEILLERVPRPSEMSEREEKFVKCPNCGRDVSKDATICPYCGRGLRRHGF